jgi:hypothetical protein
MTRKKDSAIDLGEIAVLKGEGRRQRAEGKGQKEDIDSFAFLWKFCQDA